MKILEEKELEGFHYIKVDEIPSTNSKLKLEYNNYDRPTILHALKQTNGRGRFDRIWESNNDLMFSILFFEKKNYEIIFPLSIIYSLNEYGYNAKIKWPNDIFLNGYKLAGILIESIYQSAHKATIVGIGINYNDYKELDAIGLNKNIDMQELISKIIKNYQTILKFDNNKLIEEYKKYNIVLNKYITYKNEKYLVADININGYIILEKNGITYEINSDEIKIDRKEIINQ